MFRKNQPSKLNPENNWFAAQALREARREIDRALDLVNSSTGDEDDLEGRIRETVQQLLKAWHLRNVSLDELDAMTLDEIRHVRTDIPEFSGSMGFRVVPPWLTYKELPNWKGDHER